MFHNNGDLTADRTPPAKQHLFFTPETELKKDSAVRKFRKPKKVIRALQLQTSPREIDTLHLHEQMRTWLDKAGSSKDIRTTRQRTAYEDYEGEDLTSSKLYRLYTVIRKDERDMKSLIQTERKGDSPRADTLRINLKEIAKIRMNSEVPKLIVSPREFVVNISVKSPACGFRATPSPNLDRNSPSRRHLGNSPKRKPSKSSAKLKLLNLQ